MSAFTAVAGPLVLPSPGVRFSKPGVTLSGGNFAELGDLAVVAQGDPQAILDGNLDGEFSFAMWDGATRRLVCARDRFGIRPLYHARIGESLVVTNSLPSLIPHVPHTIDRDVLADLVVFGVNATIDRTIYASIARVPPAHRLIFENGSVKLERWWSLPIPDTPLRIDESEAIEELRRLLIAAVTKRARGRVVVSMSGGVDSTSVAAALVQGGVTNVRALTSVYDSVIPDVERAWSSKAASALGIEHDFQVCDGYRPFDRWDDPRVRGYEPNVEPFAAAFLDFVGQAARSGDVLMTGQGGDPALYTSHSYFFDLLRGGRLLRFFSEALGYAITRRRRPPLLLRSRLLGRRRVERDPPEWLRVPLREVPPSTDDRVHPWRPEAFRSLTMTIWPAVFESFDESMTGHPIEYAVPYFDADLLAFLFSLPPMPHFADKDIVRRAMRGWLPDDVRLRPKTPLPADPSLLRFGEEKERWIRAVRDAHQLEELVNRRILCTELSRDESDPARRRRQAMIVAIALWLQQDQTST
jgi:asparagine synthase (glutamine-hydrolysing)